MSHTSATEDVWFEHETQEREWALEAMRRVAAHLRRIITWAEDRPSLNDRQIRNLTNAKLSLTEDILYAVKGLYREHEENMSPACNYVYKLATDIYESAAEQQDERDLTKWFVDTKKCVQDCIARLNVGKYTPVPPYDSDEESDYDDDGIPLVY